MLASTPLVLQITINKQGLFGMEFFVKSFNLSIY